MYLLKSLWTLIHHKHLRRKELELECFLVRVSFISPKQNNKRVNPKIDPTCRTDRKRKILVRNDFDQASKDLVSFEWEKKTSPSLLFCCSMENLSERFVRKICLKNRIVMKDIIPFRLILLGSLSKRRHHSCFSPSGSRFNSRHSWNFFFDVAEIFRGCWLAEKGHRLDTVDQKLVQMCSNPSWNRINIAAENSNSWLGRVDESVVTGVWTQDLGASLLPSCRAWQQYLLVFLLETPCVSLA